MTLASKTDIPHPPRLLAAGAFLSAVLCACTGAAKPAPKPANPGAELTPIAAPITGSAVQIDTRPLGSIPTDGVTLPVLSPDGRHLAVQTGVAPDLATALARPGERAPLASRVALYRIDPRGIVRLGESDGGLILGRNADARGVLVESVRPDGARWIGRLEWNTLDIEWLVQDGNVNAFGAFGADGTIVFSSRRPTERVFDLVVRKDGSSRRLPGDGTRSYVFPCMSADGSRVFAFSLRDGVLELASADTTSDEALKQSLVRSFVTDRGSDELALFMCSAQGVRDGVDGKDWILYHRSAGSLARWNATDGLRVVPGGVLALARIDEAREAVLSGGSVRVRGPAKLAGSEQAGTPTTEPGTIVTEQLGVPRALGQIENAPAILLVSPESAGARLSIVRLPK